MAYVFESVLTQDSGGLPQEDLHFGAQGQLHTGPR